MGRGGELRGVYAVEASKAEQSHSDHRPRQPTIYALRPVQWSVSLHNAPIHVDHFIFYSTQPYVACHRREYTSNKEFGDPIDDRCPAGITELRAGNDREYCNSAILLCSRLISDPSAVGSTSWLLRVVTRWGLTRSLLCVPSYLAVNLEQIFAYLQEIPKSYATRTISNHNSFYLLIYYTCVNMKSQRTRLSSRLSGNFSQETLNSETLVSCFFDLICCLL